MKIYGGIYYYFKNGLKIKMVQMKTKIVPTKILKQYFVLFKISSY